MPPKKRLGDILIECRMLTPEQLSQALAYGKEKGLRVGEAVQELGLVSEADIQWAIADQLNISQVPLAVDMVQGDAKDLVPYDFMKEKRIIPLVILGDSVSVAMPDPLDEPAQIEFQKLTGKVPSVSICTKEAFLRVLGDLFPDKREAGMARVSVGDESAEEGASATVRSPPGVGREKPQDEKLEKLFNFIIRETLVNRYSAIHLHPLTDRVKLTFRGAAGLVEKTEIDNYTLGQFEELLLSKCAFAPGRRDEGWFKIKAGEVVHRFNVNFFTSLKGKGLTLTPDTWPDVPSMARMGLEPTTLGVLGECLSREQGLVLIGGDFKAGRTRLAYSMLNDLHNTGRKVVTFESPCHQEMKGWLQFAYEDEPSLKRLIGQAHVFDGDVFYFSSIGSENLLRELLFFSSLGRLVVAKIPLRNSAAFATHLPTALEGFATGRGTMFNAFIAIQQVALLCPRCRVEDPQDRDRALKWIPRGGDLDPMNLKFFQARGCESCRKSGVAGEKFLLEVLKLGPEFTPDPAKPIDVATLLGTESNLAQARRLLKEGAISLRSFITI